MMKSLSLNSGGTVNLDTLTYEHRKYLFWVVLGVCFGLYVAFGFFIFSNGCLVALLGYSSFAISIALALLIVPSSLLWGMMYSLYKNKSTDKDEFSWASLGEILTKIAKGVIKVSPLSH